MFEQTSANQFIQGIIRAANEIKIQNNFFSGPSYQTFNAYLDSINELRLEKKINFIKSIIPKNINKGSILEIGSGYGLNLMVLKFLGFKNVKGIEIVESINSGAQLFINTAKKYIPLLGDACTSIPGDAESTKFRISEFDSIIAIEVISHVPSFDRMIREINRILKQDGLLIVIDSNNLSCPMYRKTRYKRWELNRRMELNKRIEFIRSKYPDIEPNFRASIALHTELLSFDAMERTIPEILKTNKLPMNLYFEKHAPIYAETGIWNEFGFYPLKLDRQLGLYGFKSKSQIYIGAGRNKLYKRLEELFNRLPGSVKFLFRPTFKLIARKTENTTYLLNGANN